MNKKVICNVKSKVDGLMLGVMITEAENPKGILQISHGMAEHKERYLPLIQFLSESGYHCVINDHRGHGESVKNSGDLGYFYDGGGDALVKDLYEINLFIQKRYPQLPVYLLGHSMGSLAARVFTKRHDSQINGLILCGSPSKNPAAGVGSVLCSFTALFRGGEYRSKLIDTLAFHAHNKKFLHESGGEFRWISANKENVSAYTEDPLCGFCFTLNGFKALFYLMQETYSVKGWLLKNTAMPVRFISGEDDPCLISLQKFEQAVRFLRDLGYINSSSRLFPGMRHEILNEEENQQVFNDILYTLNSWNGGGKRNEKICSCIGSGNNKFPCDCF